MGSRVPCDPANNFTPDDIKVIVDTELSAGLNVLMLTAFELV